MAGEDQELLTTLHMQVRNADTAVIQQAVHDSMVITVPIDDTLSVSGAAADALAVGNALGGKADLTTIKNTLSVNGRTGNGGLAITVNGDNVPAQSDSDTESVADALTRIDNYAHTQISSVNQGLDYLQGQLVNVIDPRLDVLEAKKLVLLRIAFTAAATETRTITGITANHELIGHQFFDSSDNPVGDPLADIAWTTAAGSVEVVFSNVQAAGSVRLVFGVPEDVTPEEASS